MILSRRTALFSAAAVAGTAALAGRNVEAMAATTSDPVTVFNGTSAKPEVRIPALLRCASETLLAVCDEGPVGDTGNTDLICKRSTDGGRTWGPRILVADHGTEMVSNPSLVQDPASGHIVLVCGTRVKRSGNDGATWTGSWTNITRPAEWEQMMHGPGAGVVIKEGAHAGRLVIAGNHRKTSGTVGPVTAATSKYKGSHCITSDDGGKTWNVGGRSSQPDGVVDEDENQVVLLDDGQTLYFNCRTISHDQAAGMRADTYSKDGGQSFTHLCYPQGTIASGFCNGSLLNPGDGTVLFAGPMPVDMATIEGRKQRIALTIWRSHDDGRTWWPSYKVTGLPSGYSSMCRIDAETIGVLWETGNYQPAERIDFQRIALTDMR
jgi:sialidase-1